MGREERSLAELELSEERLRLAVTAAKLGTWHWNLLTGELVWSDECMAIFGFPPGLMTYERFAAAVHPEDRARMSDAVETALVQHQEYDIEYRHVRPDGPVRWCSA